MNCPVCKTKLETHRQERLQSLVEHVFDPNGTPTMKHVYECPNKKCDTHGVVFWNDLGELFTDEHKMANEIKYIDNNDAPFGTPNRAINIEVCKKDENKTILNLGFIRLEKIWQYNADWDGNILKRAWMLELWIRSHRSYRYVTGFFKKRAMKQLNS